MAVSGCGGGVGHTRDAKGSCRSSAVIAIACTRSRSMKINRNRTTTTTIVSSMRSIKGAGIAAGRRGAAVSWAIHGPRRGGLQTMVPHPCDVRGMHDDAPLMCMASSNGNGGYHHEDDQTRRRNGNGKQSEQYDNAEHSSNGQFHHIESGPGGGLMDDGASQRFVLVDEEVSQAVTRGGFHRIKGLLVSLQRQIQKLDGLWSQLIPMTLLFFMMAFVNTIIDSLKDSLVITAVGGGTEVLPYLSVYGVLPSSVLFLLVYSWATRKFSREKIFNLILFVFLSFYATFAFVYPHHETLHISSMADSLQQVLPAGLSGMVGMIRNWLFTVFYCVSELWGDVVLSLLFWGLANETTSIEDAPLLYPLFGIGANVAQACAGRSLRLVSEVTESVLSYTQQVQITVALCVCLGVVIAITHSFISRTFVKNPKGSAADRRMEALVGQKKKMHGVDSESTVPGLNYCDIHPAGDGSKISDSIMKKDLSWTEGTRAQSVRLQSMAEEKNTSGSTSTSKKRQKSAKQAMNLKDAWAFLSKSPQIRCLAVMALAQGITTRVLEVSWKHYLHLLHPSPVEYAAFLGDTAMWTGVATGVLMVVSPLLFDLMGWKGVASATPNIMLFGGIPFFTACVLFTFFSSNAMVAGLLSLNTLVLTGAALQVFSRGAKFSLFKPAEEMVYIGLDDESRTKGKAAIDVVGAQSGKSIGSVLQQVMLIITGGSVSGIIPILALFYALMLQQWKTSVSDLAEHCDPSHVHRQSVMGSLDSDDDLAGNRSIPTVDASLTPVSYGG